MRRCAEEVPVIKEIRRRALGGWGALGQFPEIEVKQDLFYDRRIFNEADHLHWAAASGADEGIRFVDLFDQARPATFALFAEFLMLIRRDLLSRAKAGCKI